MHWPPNAAKAEKERRKRLRRPPRVPGDSERMILIRDTLWETQGALCAFCGQFIPPERNVERDKNAGSIDHVIPWALGGVDELGNFVLMHRLCNMVKSHEMPNGCVLIWLLAVNARLGVGPVRW